MVQFAAIQESNERFAKAQHTGLVSVFVGATAGIGYATLSKLAAVTDASTFYILGRSATNFAPKLNALKELSPESNFVFLEKQVSLISDIDAACEQIRAAEKKVDYVCLTAGGIPFEGAVYTKEGLELCFALSYYTRIRLVSNLLPLLRRASSPRVLSVLNGTGEGRIDEEDIGLEREKKWTMFGVMGQTTTLMSLAFDYLAEAEGEKGNNNNIAFIHTTPGLVDTGAASKRKVCTDSGWSSWALASMFQGVVRLLTYTTGSSEEEAGERNVFYLTSDTVAPGSRRANKECDFLPPNAVLEDYRGRGWTEKVWDYTMDVYAKVATAAPSGGM